jgi:hypothetical protein
VALTLLDWVSVVLFLSAAVMVLVMGFRGIADAQFDDSVPRVAKKPKTAKFKLTTITLKRRGLKAIRPRKFGRQGKPLSG